jgi:hypothetical protein
MRNDPDIVTPVKFSRSSMGRHTSSPQVGPEPNVGCYVTLVVTVAVITALVVASM